MLAKIGYQLSSITPHLNTIENINHSFYKLAEIGYRYVQLQGVPSEIPAHEIAKALNNSGLQCIATQEDYPFGFGDNPEKAIERAISCGAQYLCCALIPIDVKTLEDIRWFSDKLINIIEKTEEAKLIFSFHPIAPDFRDIEGKMVFEHLMEMLPNTVQLTFCVNAAFAAGVDPFSIINKYSGNMDLVHFKDDTVLPDVGKHLMPLGQGTHDWVPILQACNLANVRYVFAEQERWLKDAFQCAKESYDYLVHIGMR